MSVVFACLAVVFLGVTIAGLVNPAWAKDRKTGEIPSRASLASGSLLLAALMGGAALWTSADSHPTLKAKSASISPAANSPVTQSGRIKPESIVIFPKGGPACLTQEALQSFVELGVSGKATKARALFEDEGDGPQCIMLSPTTRYKVIDAQYNDPDLPRAAILEIVGSDVRAAEQGAFTLVMDNSLVKVVG
jgi:hypothetical protein